MDKSGEITVQVWWTSLEVGIKPSEAGLRPDFSGPLN
jgi:hypothetical protein